MKWAKRGLWLGAWGAWVWCGFGLHRELPRDLGPAASHIPIADVEQVVGFLGDESMIVTMSQSDGGSWRVRLWNAEDARNVADRPGILLGVHLTYDCPQLIRRHGLVIAFHRKDELTPSILDLRTGERRQLCEKPIRILSIHSTKPWVAAVGPTENGRRFEVSVYNVRTAEKIFQMAAGPFDEESAASVSCAFAPESDDLYIVGPADRKGGLDACRLSRLEVGSGTLPSSVELEGESWRIVAVAKNGRIMLADRFSEAWNVVDVESGRTIISSNSPEVKDARDAFRGSEPPLLSPDGRRLLTFESVVWDVERNREIVWLERKGVKVGLDLGEWPRVVAVTERWLTPSLRDAAPKISTVAVRDFESGYLLFRTWEELSPFDATWPLGRMSVDGRWGVSRKGTVYRLAPPPNWPLLAVCQAVLALPLVLLWVGRRRRRSA